MTRSGCLRTAIVDVLVLPSVQRCVHSVTHSAGDGTAKTGKLATAHCQLWWPRQPPHTDSGRTGELSSSAQSRVSATRGGVRAYNAQSFNRRLFSSSHIGDGYPTIS